MAVESTYLINFHILRVLESGRVIPDFISQKFVYSVVSRVSGLAVRKPLEELQLAESIRIFRSLFPNNYVVLVFEG